MANWTNETQPFGPNRAPLLTGLAADGSGFSVPVAVDPATGRVLVNSTGGSGPSTPTTVLNGKTIVTTAGTRVALAASTTCVSVTVKALITNTGLIYVGNSTVSSSNGLQLSAGDTISLDIANLSTVNIDAAVSGEGVTYLGVN